MVVFELGLHLFAADNGGDCHYLQKLVSECTDDLLELDFSGVLEPTELPPLAARRLPRLQINGVGVAGLQPKELEQAGLRNVDLHLVLEPSGVPVELVDLVGSQFGEHDFYVLLRLFSQAHKVNYEPSHIREHISVAVLAVIAFCLTV